VQQHDGLEHFPAARTVHAILLADAADGGEDGQPASGNGFSPSASSGSAAGTRGPADRDQARHAAAAAEQAARLAQQDVARAQAAEQAARAETGRVRADAEKMLATFRADAARDRDELRADLRARAERAEREADAYRDELTQLRAQANHGTGTRLRRQDATTHPVGYPAVTPCTRPVGPNSSADRSGSAARCRYRQVFLSGYDC